MYKNARVLIVEDAIALAETYKAYLQKDGFDVRIATTGADALGMLDDFTPELLLLDVNLPDMTGLEVMRHVKSRGVAADFIVMTSQGSVQLAVQAMREGAFEFLMKPLNADRLRMTLHSALQKRPESSATRKSEQVCKTGDFAGFIGTSPVMNQIYRMLENAAPSNATVFITGESGTGKELCAEALHKLSRRSQGPFVAMNCAAIPREILESELFGHVKGAFTGAHQDRKGAVMNADGGTLFLDEICEMDLGLQAKLLRLLQTRLVQRVGEDTPRPADIRVICATNRDPMAELAAGRFREDLFYRLHVVPMEMPPLRQRGEDVLLIARHFLKIFSQEDGKNFEGFTQEAANALLTSDWPGNVRQLQNVMRNIVVMQTGPLVELQMLPAQVKRLPHLEAAQVLNHNFSRMTSEAKHVHPAAGANRDIRHDHAVEPLDHVIRRTIEAAVAHFDGSVPRAAAALEVAPSTLYRRMQLWQSDTGVVSDYMSMQ